jgi:hypothetical protein
MTVDVGRRAPRGKTKSFRARQRHTPYSPRPGGLLERFGQRATDTKERSLHPTVAESIETRGRSALLSEKENEKASDDFRDQRVDVFPVGVQYR